MTQYPDNKSLVNIKYFYQNKLTLDQILNKLDLIEDRNPLDFSIVAHLVEFIKEADDPNVIYQSPVNIQVANVDTLIVDPHHEGTFQIDKINSVVKPDQLMPAVAVHTDNHSDLREETFSFSAVKDALQQIYGKTGDLRREYIKDFLGIDSFLISAVEEKKIGVIYNVNPRLKKVFAYGRVKNGRIVKPLTVEMTKEGRLLWEPLELIARPDLLTYRELYEELKDCKHPLINDTDLDAFLCVGDLKSDMDYEWQSRILNTHLLMRILPKPVLNIIARSQTPNHFVPYGKIDEIQEATINMLEQAYSNHISLVTKS